MNNTAPHIVSDSTDRTRKLKSRSQKLILGGALTLIVVLAMAWLVQSNRNAADPFTACLNSKGSKTTANNAGSICTTQDGKKFENSQAKLAKWTSYNGDRINFYYPPDWKVMITDSSKIYSGSTLYQFVTSDDQSFVATPSTNKQLLINTLILKPINGANSLCPCTVLAAKSVIFHSISKRAQLLAVDTNGNKQADSLVLGPESANIGDTEFNSFFNFNDKYQISLQAHIVNGPNAALKDIQYEVKDGQSLLDSTSVSSLRALLSGVTLK